jgi:hypothetical protein
VRQPTRQSAALSAADTKIMITKHSRGTLRLGLVIAAHDKRRADPARSNPGEVSRLPRAPALDVQLQDVDRFATEVIPAFRGTSNGGAAQ